MLEKGLEVNVYIPPYNINFGDYFLILNIWKTSLKDLNTQPSIYNKMVQLGIL